MLQIKNISKKYITGDLEQMALNNVSLNLRDNEFVAILGPSGSGKTTLLNIIGGLDRYDQGDLIINEISTKDYSDRDWDSYRNHTIGFVFQSYNLIPHQTVLSNVELALTISGISGSEKRERAIKALQEVGLGDQLHKKPNQMSGGQMQRVAIARALVNNPDILLADEPTGALDSDTSIQVMDLLKEVAKDRLVVMVTHNPELAQQYATRIVRLSDGKIIDDSDPYTIEETKPAVHQNMGKSSMSFMTSLALSFNNLKTKKGRTFLTSFAGSIGIIGIALILSLSNGVNTYIHNIEEETLSEYPVTISTTNVDFTSMMSLSASASADQEAGEEVNERKTISSFFSTSKKNDLQSLKTYLESGKSKVYDYANAIEYSYSITPQIYLQEDKEYRQINPNDTFSELNSVYGSFSSSLPYNVFYSLPENDNLYKGAYDVLEGRWPENKHEMVLVLSADNCVSDITLYALGLKDADELDSMIKNYKEGKDIEEVSEAGKYKYTDFVGKTFKLVDIADMYQYDSKRKLYVDKSDDTSYMNKVLKDAQDLEIVGVIRQNESSKAAMLSSGVYYPHELLLEIAQNAADSDIVKAQLKNKKINVFTGKKFDEESNDTSFDSLFTINTDALSSAFSGNSDLMSGLDLSSLNIDFSNMNIDMTGLEDVNWDKLFENITVQINQDTLETMYEDILNDYLKYASSDPSTDYASLPDAIRNYLNSDTAKNIISSNIRNILENSYQAPSQEETNAFVRDFMDGFVAYVQTNHPDATMDDLSNYINEYLQTAEAQQKVTGFIGTFDFSDLSDEDINKITSDLIAGYDAYARDNNLPDPSKMQESFTAYIESDRGQKAILSSVQKAVDLDALEKQFAQNMQGVMNELSQQMQGIMNQAIEKITTQVGGSLSSALSSVVSNMFHFDEDTFANMFKMDMSSQELQEIMMAMMTDEADSYESNLTKLNYCDFDKPSEILIYPKDFDNKSKIIDILNDYNKKMEKSGQEDKVIAFTDYVATLMSSVTDIIDTISYVLIAFVAISLVVSSIMIGIITYISVLERTKEIGILRAIGASKSNISQVFNAETFIIGLFAGILGIVITLLLLIPGNMLIRYLTSGHDVKAILPVGGAIVLIIISVILTLIGGIIPAKKAAKKDPVLALRSE